MRDERSRPIFPASTKPKHGGETQGRQDQDRARGRRLPGAARPPAPAHRRTEEHRPDEPLGLLPQLPVQVVRGGRRRARHRHFRRRVPRDRLWHVVWRVEGQSPVRGLGRAEASIPSRSVYTRKANPCTPRSPATIEGRGTSYRLSRKNSSRSFAASVSAMPPTTCGLWWQVGWSKTRGPCSTPPDLGS